MKKKDIVFDVKASFAYNVSLQTARSIYVTGVIQNETDEDTECTATENDEEADFFGVYSRTEDGTAEWLADLPTRKQAEDFADLLRKFADAYKPVDLQESKFITINLDGNSYPKEFISKVMELADYKDQILKEHLYGESTLTDKIEEEEDYFTDDEIVIIEGISEATRKAEAAYFRFTF